MSKSLLPIHPALIPLAAALLLAACATPKPPQALPRAQSAPATPAGTVIAGTIAATRPNIAGQPLPAGAAQVLAALQLQAPAQGPNATEFVIERDDGGANALVLPSPAASPTASLSGANFSPGDKVEILTGNQTNLIHAGQ